MSKPYRLGKYEVTQKEWASLMGGSPAAFKGELLPVEQVNHDDALAFCRALTTREHAAGRLSIGYVYTLPTEAEWEYACRAGTAGEYGGSGDLIDMGWYLNKSAGRTKPVGQKRANAFGLYDMHGNVWEWCLDWYAGALPGGTTKDPRGPAAGAGRVSRGGSWNFADAYCRSASRSVMEPGLRNRHLGFRLALTSVSK